MAVADDSADAGARGSEAVAATNITHGPSEAERVLRMLWHQYNRLIKPAAHRGDGGSSSSHAAGAGSSSRNAAGLQAAAEAHLEALEATRKLFIEARALSMAQRSLLYAHDELDMAVMRFQLR